MDFKKQTLEHNTELGLQSEHILELTFTVSPQISNPCVKVPTIPATTGPLFTPIKKLRAGSSRLSRSC